MPSYAPPALPLPSCRERFSLSTRVVRSFTSPCLSVSPRPSLFHLWPPGVLSLLRFFVPLVGNSLLFFARFATRAVARATDKFCRDIAFGIIAIMSASTFLAAPCRAPYFPRVYVYTTYACTRYTCIRWHIRGSAGARARLYLNAARTYRCVCMHVVPNLHRAFNIGRLRHNFPAGSQSWPTGTRGSLRFIPCTDTRISAEICTKNAA